MMKELSKYLFSAIIGALIIIIFFKDCSGSTNKKIEVTIPGAKGGSGEIINPTPSPKTDTLYYPVPGKPGEKEIIKIPVVDEKYKEMYINTLDKYLATKDSLERFKQYAEATQINEYDIPTSDSLVDTFNHIVTQGKLLSFENTYDLKSRKIEFAVPETKFRFLAGIETGVTFDFQNPALKANLGFQNKKGNILNFSADTNQYFWVGYNWNILTIKK